MIAVRTLSPANFRKRCLHAYALRWGRENITECLRLLELDAPCHEGLRAISQTFGTKTRRITFRQFRTLAWRVWTSYVGFGSPAMEHEAAFIEAAWSIKANRL